MTNEERMLGLDPSLYTQKAWNPANYVSPMKSLIERMRQEQEAILGPEAKELTPEEQAEFNRMKLKKLMGE